MGKTEAVHERVDAAWEQVCEAAIDCAEALNKGRLHESQEAAKRYVARYEEWSEAVAELPFIPKGDAS